MTINVAAAQVEFLAREPAELLGSTLTSHLGATASWSGFGLVELLTLPAPVAVSGAGDVSHHLGGRPDALLGYPGD